MNHSRVIYASLAALVGVFCCVRSADAWDSVTRPATPNHPVAKPLYSPPQIPTGPFPPNFDPHAFTMSVLKDYIGGTVSGGQDDLGVTKILKCAQAPSVKGGTIDMSSCEIAVQSDLDHAQWAWLKLREAADVPHDSEHYLIAKAAADQAGLTGTSMFSSFWVRYPTENSLTVSPRDLDGDGRVVTGSPYLVTPSWLPASELAGSTQTARRVSLLELAQLPDFSSSIADWAAGDEMCPLAGVKGGFDSNLSPSQACHQFEYALGATNATHFSPLNHSMWTYYHYLAMTRMAECKSLDDSVKMFYDYTEFQAQLLYPATASEGKECEIEAMAYEMFAQHFLQDAWSTGHMWNRWGGANLTDFGTDVKLYPNEPPPPFPAENASPRRTTIALTVAAIAGTIHGAKSVELEKLRYYLGFTGMANFASDVANRNRLLDDPLNGPIYTDYLGFVPMDRNVEWISSLGTFPGAGDLFWDPKDAPLGGVGWTASRWDDQQKQLLKCSAASMLEVYKNGGRLHGEPAASTGLDGFKASDPSCWSQLATNASMFGALGVLPLEYAGGADGHIYLAGLVNSVVLRVREDMTGFAADDPASADPSERARAADRDAFFLRLNTRLGMDSDVLGAQYAYNAMRNPDGTESARGTVFQHPEQLASMLGMQGAVAPDPGSDPNAAPPAPAPYVDKLHPQNTAAALLPASGTLDSAISRMFWRGNLERTCRTSLANGASELLGLQAQCIAASAKGGDPNACTACVELAEPHIPRCFELGVPWAERSKCSALGVDQIPGPPPTGLPSWWFDFDYRHIPPANLDNLRLSPGDDLCYDSLDVAMDWCTGTNLLLEVDADSAGYSNSGYAAVRDSLVNFVQVGDKLDCPHGIGLSGEPGTLVFGTDHRRRASALMEDLSPNPSEWLFPLISSFEYDTTFAPAGSGDPCFSDEQRVSDTSIARIEAAIAPAPPSQFLNYGTYSGGSITAPRCGVQQRVSAWNQSCTVVGPLLGITLAANDTTDPVTGFLLQSSTPTPHPGFPSQSFCDIHEARHLKTDCPDGMTCVANGECVAGGAIPLLSFTTAALAP